MEPISRVPAGICVDVENYRRPRTSGRVRPSSAPDPSTIARRMGEAPTTAHRRRGGHTPSPSTGPRPAGRPRGIDDRAPITLEWPNLFAQNQVHGPDGSSRDEPLAPSNPPANPEPGPCTSPQPSPRPTHARLHEFMRRHSFAVLTSNGESGLVASHLPLLLDAARWAARPPARAHGQGQPAVARRRGRGHGRLLGAARLRLAVVVRGGGHRPDLELRRRPRLRHPPCRRGSGRAARHPAAIGGGLRGPEAEPWDFDESAPHVEQMLKAIVGFRIEITRLEGKWKLSQNHPEERRRRVIRALSRQSDGDSRAIADLMVEGPR